MRGGLAAVGSLGLAGCNHYFGGPPAHAPAHGRRTGGPPPHAPAHGYRRKHRRSGHDLVFDSGLGVYLVVGQGHYFYRDRFYRWHKGAWHVGRRARGPWRRAGDHEVPRRLFKSKVKGKGKFKGRRRGRGRYKDRGSY